MRSREPSLSPEPWSWNRPRVLIEDSDEARAGARASLFRQRGYAVAVCPGPTAESRCPLADDDGCAAAAGADLVVSSLGFETLEARQALAALRERVPNVPLLVAADVGPVVRWPELVEGCDVVAAAATPDEVVARADAIVTREDVDGA